MTRNRNQPRTRRMFIRRRSRVAGTLLALAAIIVTGCAQDEQTAGEPPRVDYRDIQVEWVAIEHNVAFRESSAVVTDAEFAAIQAFLNRVDIRLTDQIALDPGAGTDLLLARARADAISKRLRERLPGARVRLLEQSTGGESRLVVGRYVAVAPECAGWYSPEQRIGMFANPDNRTDPNFGCSTASNFAAMIADPGDLVRGRALAPADSAGQALAIERYRILESPHPHTAGYNKGTHGEIE